MAHILLVEDNRNIRLLISSALGYAGHHVIEARDGQSALALLQFMPHIDIVLSDIHMPFMNGIELLETIRSQYPRVPVMILTAYYEHRQEALQKGAVEYVQKPFHTPTLVRLVQDTLALQN